MSEPVMCHVCGESYADYPPEGKCSRCGTTIPTPAAAPVPAKRAPQQSGGIDGIEPRRGVPRWVTLLLLSLFVVGASIGTYTYMKKWGREKQEGYVTSYLKQCRKLADEDNIGEAVKYLRTAKIQAQKLDESDPLRARLLAKIEGERERLRADLRKRLTQLVEEGNISEAEKLYASGVETIDQGDSLRTIIEKAISDRSAMRQYQSTLADAKGLNEKGDYGGALKKISDLRKDLESPTVTATIHGVGKLAEEVAALQTQWVKDTLNRGYAELEQGKLGEADAWFKQARLHVWPSEQSLVRKLEDVIFQIERKRVAGVYVKVGRVRMASADEIQKELFKEVREKLVREDFLMVKLDGVADPKGREFQRLLVLDYHEDPAGMLTVKPGSQVRATKITCDLKLVVPGAAGELWNTSVYRETGPVDAATPGGITEKTLRDNAAVLFWNAFVSVPMPRNLLFH